MCEQKKGLPGNVLNGRGLTWERHFLAFLLFLLPPAWCWDVMAGTSADILKHKLTLGVKAKHLEGGRETLRCGFLSILPSHLRTSFTEYTSILFKPLLFCLFVFWNVELSVVPIPQNHTRLSLLNESQVWVSQSTTLPTAWIWPLLRKYFNKTQCFLSCYLIRHQTLVQSVCWAIQPQ